MSTTHLRSAVTTLLLALATACGSPPASRDAAPYGACSLALAADMTACGGAAFEGRCECTSDSCVGAVPVGVCTVGCVTDADCPAVGDAFEPQCVRLHADLQTGFCFARGGGVTCPEGTSLQTAFTNYAPSSASPGAFANVCVPY